MGAFWGLRDAAGARGAAAFCAASGTDRMQRPGALERSLARYLRSYRAKLEGPFGRCQRAGLSAAGRAANAKKNYQYTQLKGSYRRTRPNVTKPARSS